MSVDISAVIQYLDEGALEELFAEELLWRRPSGKKPLSVSVGGVSFDAVPVAELTPYGVFEVQTETIPESTDRAKIQRQLSKQVQESILIFTNTDRSQQAWQWIKRDGKRITFRTHAYFRQERGLEFVSKLASLTVDLDELDEKGKLPIVEAAAKVAAALDNEKVVKRFFTGFAERRPKIAEAIHGIPNERERDWYVSVLVNRILFIYFLQKRLFLDNGTPKYLEEKLTASKIKGKDKYYRDFLYPLFFEAFAKPDNSVKALTGKIPYLNGGLFLPHHLEETYHIEVEDRAFEELFGLLGDFNWAFHTEPDRPETISPGVLGYIFEKYINQKEFGAYYTRPQITEYLCRQTIHQLILDKAAHVSSKKWANIEELVFQADAKLCRYLLEDILPSIRVLDPACGSGAFLVAALDTLVKVYETVAGRAHLLEDAALSDWIRINLETHRSRRYEVHKRVITKNLYGVDIMPEACEIARLRLFMALVACVEDVKKLEPLPNIDFNVMPGNTLVGLLRVEDEELQKQGSLFAVAYPELVQQKNVLVNRFQKADARNEDPADLRRQIEKLENEARPVLDEILLHRFQKQRVFFEQATWDDKKGKEGTPKKRPVTQEDIQRLRPFHWSFEFSEAMRNSGFDAILTNPPWVVWETSEKEFFRTYDSTITKNRIRIEDWDVRKADFLNIPEVKAAWLEYLSGYPHVGAYYKSAPQFSNQISYIDGRNAGSKSTLQGLFTEQCFNLLKASGLCGIVLPSGFYTDVGPKALRNLLFDEAEVTGLFGFENRKLIFDNVDSRFKFAVLSFRKEGYTPDFPAVFMRHEVEELERFPGEVGFRITRSFIEQTAPKTLSLLEIKNAIEFDISSKLRALPFLGDNGPDAWRLSLATELNMTTHKFLFRPASAPNRVPLFEGKMIHHFTHEFASPTRWIDKTEGGAIAARACLTYRLAYRSIARSTDERTMIATILPKQCFFGHSLNAITSPLQAPSKLFLLACLNSFVLDFYLRLAVSANITMPFIYQLKVPRYVGSTSQNRAIGIVSGLVCTSPEFAELWNDVFENLPPPIGCPQIWTPGCGKTDLSERGHLRAELDGLVAHVYGLTEEEFAHILTTFPLVKQDVKDAAMAEYQRLAAEVQEEAADPLLAETRKLIERGENDGVEFKETLDYVDPAHMKYAAIQEPQRGQKIAEDRKAVIHSALKTLCAYLNSEGGSLLIGVHNDQRVIGLERDFEVVKDKNADGFELKLRNLIGSRFQPKPFSLLKVRFPVLDGKTVCRVDVTPNHTIFHLDGAVYVRDGNQTVQLVGMDLTEWIRKKSTGGSNTPGVNQKDVRVAARLNGALNGFGATLGVYLTDGGLDDGLQIFSQDHEDQPSSKYPDPSLVEPILNILSKTSFFRPSNLTIDGNRVDWAQAFAMSFSSLREECEGILNQYAERDDALISLVEELKVRAGNLEMAITSCVGVPQLKALYENGVPPNHIDHYKYFLLAALKARRVIRSFVPDAP